MEKREILGFENYKIDQNGNVYNDRSVKLTIYVAKASGRLRVGLSKNGKPQAKEIHRLLAIAFIPNPESKKCVDHIDGNHLNNSLDNLRWVSHSENTFNGPKKNGKVIGVNKSMAHGYERWKAYIFKDGKPYTKSYPFTDEGYNMAVEWRRSKELELYGFSPENNNIIENNDVIIKSGHVGIIIGE